MRVLLLLVLLTIFSTASAVSPLTHMNDANYVAQYNGFVAQNNDYSAEQCKDLAVPFGAKYACLVEALQGQDAPLGFVVQWVEYTYEACTLLPSQLLLPVVLNKIKTLQEQIDAESPQYIAEYGAYVQHWIAFMHCRAFLGPDALQAVIDNTCGPLNDPPASLFDTYGVVQGSCHPDIQNAVMAMAAMTNSTGHRRRI